MWWGLQLQNPDVRCNWQPRTKIFLISFDHLESLSSHFQSPSSHFQSFSNHFQSFRVNHSNFINLDTSKFINSSSPLFIFPAMVPLQAALDVGFTSVPAHPQPTILPPGRSLQREGARFFLSAAEQAVEDAMNRSSSPIPELSLGKRTRPAGDPEDGNDTEQDEDLSSPVQPSSTTSSFGNVTAAALRYASKKKLRPEQRDEVEALLLMSTSCVMSWCLYLNIRQDTALGRQAKLFICVYH